MTLPTRSISRSLVAWALAPIALLVVALLSAELRVVSSKFIYIEAGIFWPAWNLSFWLLENDKPTSVWLFAMNLPYYYVLLSPTPALGSSRRAIRIIGIVVLLALILAHLWVSGIMASFAYEFTYGDHNFIPR